MVDGEEDEGVVSEECGEAGRRRRRGRGTSEEAFPGGAWERGVLWGFELRGRTLQVFARGVEAGASDPIPARERDVEDFFAGHRGRGVDDRQRGFVHPAGGVVADVEQHAAEAAVPFLGTGFLFVTSQT